MFVDASSNKIAFADDNSNYPMLFIFLQGMVAVFPQLTEQMFLEQIECVYGCSVAPCFFSSLNDWMTLHG